MESILLVQRKKEKKSKKEIVIVKCGIHNISKRERKKAKNKREVVENFTFLNILYFLWTSKNDKCTLFFLT